MYSIKQARNSKSHNMHYRMIRHFSVDLAVVTLVTTLTLMPIFSQAIEIGLQNGPVIRDKEVTTLLRDKRPDWNDICNKISFALISPCSDLVNPDNTLIQQGEHVKGCIQNGAGLAGAALLLGFPPTAILSILPMIAQLGGCGDVVNFGAVTLGS